MEVGREDTRAESLALLLVAPEREALAEKDWERTGMGLGEISGVRVGKAGDGDGEGVAKAEGRGVTVPSTTPPPVVPLAQAVVVAEVEGQEEGEGVPPLIKLPLGADDAVPVPLG